MNNMRNKILMTLALLLTAVMGAWADEATITLKCGTTEKTYENVTLPWSSTGDILKQVISDYKNVASNIDAITGGDGKVVKYGNEQFTVTGTFSGEATVVVSWYNSSKQSATITVTAPGPLLTLNEAKTEATMESMPTSDVTVNYTLVRDMSVQMTATMGDGTDGLRYRVKKNEQNPGKYEPADMDMMQVLKLVAVNDGIEQKALTLNQDYFCRIYKLDEQTQQPDGDGVELADFDFAPGLYALKAFATDGSNYDGETALSNTFKLFQGYEVEVPAGEYITYYKDEALYVEDTDAKLYTITAVSGTTATADELNIAPANTPLLVKNNGSETKTILLIPTTTDTPDNVTPYEGFTGTLEAATIAASDATQDNYAWNGLQFVWVKTALSIAANKAWLQVPATASAPQRIQIVFSSTTGIGAIDGLQSEGEGAWYDLNGRRLPGKPTKKGVYIVNGKKMVVK